MVQPLLASGKAARGSVLRYACACDWRPCGAGMRTLQSRRSGGAGGTACATHRSAAWTLSSSTSRRSLRAATGWCASAQRHSRLQPPSLLHGPAMAVLPACSCEYTRGLVEGQSSEYRAHITPELVTGHHAVSTGNPQGATQCLNNSDSAAVVCATADGTCLFHARSREHTAAVHLHAIVLLPRDPTGARWGCWRLHPLRLPLARFVSLTNVDTWRRRFYRDRRCTNVAQNHRTRHHPGCDFWKTGVWYT